MYSFQFYRWNQLNVIRWTVRSIQESDSHIFRQRLAPVDEWYEYAMS